MWTDFTTWLFVEAGQKLAYTLCPTAALPQLRADLRAAEVAIDREVIFMPHIVKQ